MKFIGFIALAGLAACSVDHTDFSFEVTQRSANEVRIQTHKGALGMDQAKVDAMFAHMDGIAAKECQGFGKRGARFSGDRTYTTGVYYGWHERIYSCV